MSITDHPFPSARGAKRSFESAMGTRTQSFFGHCGTVHRMTDSGGGMEIAQAMNHETAVMIANALNLVADRIVQEQNIKKRPAREAGRGKVEAL